MREKYDFHVDMSGRIYTDKTIGIALVEAKTRVNYGCALKGNLIKLIKKELFMGDIFEDSAKLYAICIYLLAREVKDKVITLIICNDEDFNVVKKSLGVLLNGYDFEIISITEFRKRLGRNVGSLADNYARVYRKKALKPHKLWIGKKINVIRVTFKIIKFYWEELNKKIK